MTNKLSLAVLCLFGVAVLAIPVAAFADGGTWSLDPTTSSARFFQGSAANPDSVNSGVARVKGEVTLDPNDLTNSVLDLAIYPSDENWSALNPDGTLPSGYTPDSTDNTLLTFKSERMSISGNGDLQVTGNLKLVRVERDMTIEPTEAYAGPTFGSPVIQTSMREVTFVVPNFSAARGAESVAPAVMSNRKTLEMRATTAIGYRDFPELLKAVAETNWPAVVEDEDCQLPSNVGEDYSGASCTGTVIAAVNYDNCQVPSNVGESYSGPQCAPAAGRQTTIALQLNLIEASKVKVLTGTAQ